MLIIYGLLYLAIGYLVSSLCERYDLTEISNNKEFIHVQLTWPFLIIALLVILPLDYLNNKFNEPSKLRKWIRGF